MWLSLIFLKFFLCTLALTNATLAIFDLSSCIYKFTEPLISSYDDLYLADEELDYFSDNDELYGDYEGEEEGQKASEQAYIAHEVHRAFISRSIPIKDITSLGLHVTLGRKGKMKEKKSTTSVQQKR
jgi:hypothetical protein